MPRPAALTRSCCAAVGPSATVLGKTDGGIQVIATAGHDTQCAVAAMPAAAGEHAGVPVLRHLVADRLRAGRTHPNAGEPSRRFVQRTGCQRKDQLLKEHQRSVADPGDPAGQYRRAGAEYSYNDLEQLARAAEPFTCFIDPDDPRFSTPGDLPDRIRDFCRETGQPVPEKRRRRGTLHLREFGDEVPLCFGSDQRPHRAGNSMYCTCWAAAPKTASFVK